MKITSGTEVFTSNGERVGQVRSVVMTPNDQAMTHLVVERGFLGAEAKVLPLMWIAQADDSERLVLTASKEQFDELPDFQEQLYLPLDAVDRPERAFPDAYYYYGAPGFVPLYPATVATAPALGAAMPEYREQTIENIPNDTVALDVNAPVVSRDGKQVGRIEKIFTSGTNGEATHFLVSKGVLFHTHKLIPTGWVQTVEDNQVQLHVDARVLERLPDYKGE
ncbi:MAG: DUF2171 domain-containing protein [Blastochloris sp.]|nr:DUF2171 domain-containing protein [Blastochloris sp.]